MIFYSVVLLLIYAQPQTTLFFYKDNQSQIKKNSTNAIIQAHSFTFIHFCTVYNSINNMKHIGVYRYTVRIPVYRAYTGIPCVYRCGGIQVYQVPIGPMVPLSL